METSDERACAQALFAKIPPETLTAALSLREKLFGPLFLLRVHRNIAPLKFSDSAITPEWRGVTDHEFGVTAVAVRARIFGLIYSLKIHKLRRVGLIKSAEGGRAVIAGILIEAIATMDMPALMRPQIITKRLYEMGAL